MDMLSEACAYDRMADEAEIDGNGDPEYLRRKANELRNIHYFDPFDYSDDFFDLNTL